MLKPKPNTPHAKMYVALHVFTCVTGVFRQAECQPKLFVQEEKAELKSQNYLLEKEKAALDLQLSGKQSQEHAYVVQIDHLKSELYEQEQQQQRSAKPGLKVRAQILTLGHTLIE